MQPNSPDPIRFLCVLDLISFVFNAGASDPIRCGQVALEIRVEYLDGGLGAVVGRESASFMQDGDPALEQMLKGFYIQSGVVIQLVKNQFKVRKKCTLGIIDSVVVVCFCSYRVFVCGGLHEMASELRDLIQVLFEKLVGEAGEERRGKEDHQLPDDVRAAQSLHGLD